MPEPVNYVLPLSIAQVVDVGQVLREVILIDEHLNQTAIKDPRRQVIVKASPKLMELFHANTVNISDKAQRSGLIAWLNNLKKTSPIINVSFGAEAGVDFTEKIVKWFREQIDPRCLLIVGLEPAIAAGSVVRTNNKVFNLSLKIKLKNNQTALFDAIKNLEAVKTP